MKVINKKTVMTNTTIKVSHEDLINALNASGNYDIPYDAKVWIDCEQRQKYNINEGGYVNINFNKSEEIPEEIDEPVPF